MNSKVYDILKYIQRVFLPALLTFYGVVGATCNIPYTQEVITIGTAFIAMMGAMLEVSSANYKSKVEDIANGDSK